MDQFTMFGGGTVIPSLHRMEPRSQEWLRRCQALFNRPVDSLPPLPPIYKIMASRASNDSAYDLRTLKESIYINNELAEYPDLIDIFFRHLDKDPPSEYTTKTQQQTVQLCAVAMDGIMTALLCLRFTIASSNSMIVQKVSYSWPSIWKWIDYFHKNAGSTPLFPMSQPKLKRIIIRIFGHFFMFSPNPVTRAASATPGFCPIVIESWVWQSRRDPTRYEMQEHYQADCVLVTTIISTLIMDDSSNARFIVESMNGDVDKIASVLLKYVRIAIEGGQEWFTAFCLLISTSGLLSEQTPGLMHALLAQHSIIDVTHACAEFSSIRASQCQTPELLQFCLLTCLQYVFEGARTTDGFTWIVQAVRSRLLPSMLRSARWKNKELDQRIVDSLKILGSYLVYRSVFRAVDRALQDSTISLLESEISSNTQVKEIWEEFKLGVQKLRDSKEQFHEMAGKHQQKCSAPECTMIEGHEGFRMCGACHEARYCSKACQKSDWKGGHRTACESIRKFRAEGRSSEVLERDISFFFKLLQNDLYDREPALLHLRDETLSAEPSARNSFIILFNYASFPATYGAFSSRTFSRLLDPLQVKSQIIPMPPMSRPTSMQVKRKKSSTVVNIAMLIRYGERYILLWAHPELGSGLLGWHFQCPEEFKGAAAAAQEKGPASTFESPHEHFSKLDLGRDPGAIEPESLEYKMMKALKSTGVDAADFQSALNHMAYHRDFVKEGVYGIVRPD